MTSLINELAFLPPKTNLFFFHLIYYGFMELVVSYRHSDNTLHNRGKYTVAKRKSSEQIRLEHSRY